MRSISSFLLLGFFSLLSSTANGFDANAVGSEILERTERIQIYTDRFGWLDPATVADIQVHLDRAERELRSAIDHAEEIREQYEEFMSDKRGEVELEKMYRSTM